MTDKEKAQTYDEALKKASAAHKDEDRHLKATLERIFPELKEDDGERIKKELIQWVDEFPDTIWRGHYKKDIIAWLEKQRKPKSYWKPTEEQYEALDYAYNSCPDTERGNYYEGVLETLIEDLHMLEKQGKKSTDKIEPKFKVGDKIVNGFMKYMGAPGTQGTILKITDDKYIFTDGSHMSISNQDSWELVSDKKPKFDPKTLKPFDKVLVRDSNTSTWRCTFYSHTREDGSKWKYITGNSAYEWCIPYNDDTKHLVGTTDEAPEYYKYWEE